MEIQVHGKAHLDNLLLVLVRGKAQFGTLVQMEPPLYGKEHLASLDNFSLVHKKALAHIEVSMCIVPEVHGVVYKDFLQKIRLNQLAYMDSICVVLQPKTMKIF